MNDYEQLESLGPAHPSQVSLTVAEAEHRESHGIPLPISGDPVTVADPIEREWLRNNPGQPSPFNAEEHALEDRLLQYCILSGKFLRKDWIPVDPVSNPVHNHVHASFTALAGVQRRLMIGGRLPCAEDAEGPSSLVPMFPSK